MPVPPPAPPKASSGCLVAAVAVVALLGFGLLATLLAVADREPAPPATIAPPPPGAVLLSEQGRGPLTAVLSSGTAWALHWSFDCAARPAGSGTFAIELHGPVRPSGVDERGARGNGTEHAAAGTYRLTVRSSCLWTLIAVTT
jgi:hypothetical protein